MEILEVATETSTLLAEMSRIADARHHDPFSILGPHNVGFQTEVRVYIPNAREVRIADGDRIMQRLGESDFFTWRGDANELPPFYRIAWVDDENREHIYHDPYCFPVQISDFDLHLFSEGKLQQAYNIFGAHTHEIEGKAGILYSVWAPNAERVSVVGEFNQWDGRRHPMRVRGNSGVWELFIPDLQV